jgi:uncharacterized protein
VVLLAAICVTVQTARAQQTPSAPVVEPKAASTPSSDADAPLDPGERDLLLRIAWQTLIGHLTDHPIRDQDLAGYNLTPRLTGRRGCFVTLRKGSEVRGNQGEIEASRPLFQQVIVFTRRAATHDPRFLPLTDRDLGQLLVEISVIGRRDRIDKPGEIQMDRHGVFLEKWGRRALFLPGQAAMNGWGPERELDELCKQAALPAGAWRQGARLEVFTADVIAGAQPPPPVAEPVQDVQPPLPAAGGDGASPGRTPSPAGGGR